MKRVLSAILCLTVSLSLCTCGKEALPAQAVPETESVVAQTQAQTQEPPEPESTAPQEDYYAEFTTDNGLVEVSLNDGNADPIPATMPILRVRPKVISSGMARQMAEAMFGDAELYEYSEELSKAEIADMIAAFEQGLTDQAIREDYGENASQQWINSVRDGRMAILEYYRNAYANAREEVSPVPCQWKYWPDEHYTIHGFDYAGTDPSYTDEIPNGLSVTLRATTTANGIPYEFWVNNNESADFRNHSLSVFVLEPGFLFAGDVSDEVREARWLEWNTRTGLYSPAPATEEELDAACMQAVRLAEDMGLGEWQFSAEVSDMTSVPGGGWQIKLDGLPLYEGFPVSKQNQLGNMRSRAQGAQNYYYESLTMVMKNDGTLINLNYCSPLELVEVMEEAVPLMSREQIESMALNIMHGWDYGDLLPYDSEKAWWISDGGVVTDASAAIDSVRVGYARVKYDATDFLMIPTITFRGKAEILGVLPGIYESPMDFLMAQGDGRDSLLVLDLRDGSQITVRNPAM